ncbi:MAG TPA: hypothetical protein VFN35_33145 [Ktedonobacteraceae bacterium]|nr:hypothetical protein [Ktedonobacteraceae bacterium]
MFSASSRQAEITRADAGGEISFHVCLSQKLLFEAGIAFDCATSIQIGQELFRVGTDSR